MDWNRKRELYAEYGVREYWIVAPEVRLVWLLPPRDGTLDIAGVYGDGQAVSSTVIEGFSVDPSDIF